MIPVALGLTVAKGVRASTGDRDDFYAAWTHYRQSREHRGQKPAGEDFDFDDAQQMRRRPPRLSAAQWPHLSRTGHSVPSSTHWNAH
jgi:hypothetical protein